MCHSPVDGPDLFRGMCCRLDAVPIPTLVLRSLMAHSPDLPMLLPKIFVSFVNLVQEPSPLMMLPWHRWGQPPL